MKLIRMPDASENLPEGVVATIGNFDGVHLGHQKMLDRIKAIAQHTKLPMMVILFEPQSEEYFSKGTRQPRLTSLREKLTIFNRYGIDYVAILPFQRIVSLSALDFVKNILCDGFHVRSLVVGDDFHFGKDRLGDFAFLLNWGEQLGFTVENTPTVMLNDVLGLDTTSNLPLQNRISSSWIREVLGQGNIQLAEKLLGHPYRVCGRVVYGKGIGRKLQVPTANVDLKGRMLPLKGVFVVEASGIDKKPNHAVASVGYNPTIRVSKSTPLLEVHLLDFDVDIYGRFIEITFLYRLRDEKRFDSLESLRQQILVDIQRAKIWFEKNGEGRETTSRARTGVKG